MRYNHNRTVAHLNCLFCEDKRQRMYIFLDRMNFYCHNCGRKGEHYEIKELIENIEKQVKNEKPVNKVKPEIKNELVTWENFPDVAKTYILSRLPEDLIKQYKILFCKSGEFKNRIILPVYENGNIVYFQARSINKYELPKYKNPTKEMLGKGKSEIVFNLENQGKETILHEGFLNAISVKPHGIAIFGKSISDCQIHKILNHGIEKITVFLDYDALKEALNICQTFINYGLQVKLAVLKENDCNGCPILGQKALENAITLDKWKIMKAYAKGR